MAAATQNTTILPHDMQTTDGLHAKKQLVVVGDEQTVAFFSFVGATGFVIQPQSVEFAELVAFIRLQVRTIGAILVVPELADALTERLERMQGVSIPIVRLPNTDGSSHIGFLEKLMEQAVGMKLDTEALFRTSKD